MKKCPQCGRTYSDMVTMCPACNIALGNGQQPKTRQETVERPIQETAGRPVQETVERPIQETVQSAPVRAGTTSNAPREKAKMTAAGYFGWLGVAIFVYAFFHNLNLFGMEDAVQETVPALFMMVIPLLLVDQVIRANKDGDHAKAGKLLLGIAVSIGLFFVIFV